MNEQIDNKAIEEMAKILSQADENSYAHCRSTKSCKECKYNIGKFPCTQNCRAEALYNAGYKQPINEDEVVISKKEYDKLKGDNKELSAIVKVHKYCVGANHCQNQGEIRKETAREILQRLWDCRTEWHNFYQDVFDEVILAEWVKQLAKVYGVEVK